MVEAGPGAVVSAEAVSIGLIVTELLINAVKHAFPEERTGRICVKYDASGSDWRLSVSDDGAGRLSRDGQPLSNGLGTSIVEALGHQLDARVEISSGADGTIVSVIHGAEQKSIAASAQGSPVLRLELDPKQRQTKDAKEADHNVTGWVLQVVRQEAAVLFGKWSGTEVKIDSEELLIMKESDVMGVIEKVQARRKAA